MKNKNLLWQEITCRNKTSAIFKSARGLVLERRKKPEIVEEYMMKLLSAIMIVLLALLCIDAVNGGFVNEPTQWNDPNFKGLNSSYLCPFCGIGPFNYTDFLTPQAPAQKPVVEPEKPIPIVIPGPVPVTNPGIASLIASLSQNQPLVPSGRLPTIF